MFCCYHWSFLFDPLRIIEQSIFLGTAYAVSEWRFLVLQGLVSILTYLSHLRFWSCGWTNCWERNLGSVFLLHVSFILHFLSKGKVTRLKASCFQHGVSNGPRVNFPSLTSLVFVGLEQIIVWLEVWHNVHFASVASPTKVKNNQWQKFHHIKCWRYCMTLVTHEHWPDGLFCKECSFFEFHNAGPVRSSSLSKY